MRTSIPCFIIENYIMAGLLRTQDYEFQVFILYWQFVFSWIMSSGLVFALKNSLFVVYISVVISSHFHYLLHMRSIKVCTCLFLVCSGALHAVSEWKIPFDYVGKAWTWSEKWNCENVTYKILLCVLLWATYESVLLKLGDQCNSETLWFMNFLSLQVVLYFIEMFLFNRRNKM